MLTFLSNMQLISKLKQKAKKNKESLVYLFPILTTIFTILRMLIILRFGGAEALGLFGLLLSFITLLTMLVQIGSNQVVIVELIHLNLDERLRIFSTIFCLAVSYIFIVGLLLIVFGSYFTQINSVFENGNWKAIVFVTLIVTLVQLIFDLKSLVENRLILFYSSITINTLISLISSYIILITFDYSHLIFIPLVSGIFTIAYYSFWHKTYIYKKTSLKDFVENIRMVYKLVNKSWQINLIPINSALFDFFIKSIFASYSSLAVLGYYQTIISMEAMTGNIFLGTFYRKVLLTFSNLRSCNKYSLNIIIRNTLFLSIIPICGMIFYYIFSKHFPSLKSVEIILLPLLVVSIFRIPSNIWGAFGQILIAFGEHLIVTKIEIISKIFSTTIVVIFLICSPTTNVWSYPFSIVILSIVFVPLLLWISNNKILKNTNEYNYNSF